MFEKSETFENLQYLNRVKYLNPLRHPLVLPQNVTKTIKKDQKVEANVIYFSD